MLKCVKPSAMLLLLQLRQLGAYVLVVDNRDGKDLCAGLAASASASQEKMKKSDGIDDEGKRRRRCRRCSEMHDARCAILSAERLTPRKLTNGRLRYTICRCHW